MAKIAAPLEGAAILYPERFAITARADSEFRRALYMRGF